MYPRVESKIKKNNSSIIQLKGINFSDNYSDGEMKDSYNISANRFPYISTRPSREKLNNYANATSLSAHSKLVVIEGQDVYYDGTKVPNLQVSEGEKQIFSINTKIVIFPDWKIIDLSGSSPTGASFISVDTDLSVYQLYHTGSNIWRFNIKSTNTDEFAKLKDIASSIKKNCFFTISNCTANTKLNTIWKANKDSSYSASSTTANLYIDVYIPYGTVSDTMSNFTIHINRTIPDMDYVCVHNNRVYGCSNKTQAIYASALGLPFEWNDFSGLSTDSYVVNVASAGDFVGCCSYSSSVLFWKQDKLHKLVGDYPAEYYTYTYDVEGLKKGAYKSMQTINEVLYYMGINGVYMYKGKTPTLISSNFGNKDFTDAIAGTDGDTYYLSVMEGDKPYLFAYETKYGLWVLEEHIRCKDFARIGKELYFLSNGYIYKMNSGEEELEWMIQFSPMYETIDGKKTYSRLVIRTELPKGSYIRVAIKVDDGKWVETTKILGKGNGCHEIMLPINRCDKFELKLFGKGKMAILSILREYAVRSIT